MLADSAYCVVRRATVRIAWTPLRLHDIRELPDTPVPICLDFGEGCRVGRCPTFQVPRDVMAAWVARAGLGRDRLPERHGRCTLCGEAADLQEITKGRLYCPCCGGIGVEGGAGEGKGESPA